MLVVSVVIGLAADAARAELPLLLREPSVSRSHVVFSFAGDLWLVGREGGDARRLTAGVGPERRPLFSPDGRLIAFTGEYDGNVDVFVVPAAGGVPRRLTAHAGRDEALGWTPDGTRVLIRSGRDTPSGLPRLFTIGLDGGLAEPLPLPYGIEGSYAPDGARIAYGPTFQFQRAWKRYRGGETKRLWIATLADSSVVEIPRENSNDFNPMWVGECLYFLSDRDGRFALYAYDLATRKVSLALANDGFDFKSAAAGPDAIVIEQFGALLLFDTATRQARRLEVHIAGDLPEPRPRLQKVDPRRVLAWDLSRSGARAAFEARGEILSVPAEKGDVRNLTRTPGAAERDPAFSPDGLKVAYLSDASGEYALEIRDASGLGEARRIGLGDPPSFFYRPTWSPDGKKIALTDKRLNLWVVDVASGAMTKADSDRFDSPVKDFRPAWSPDGQWLAYAKALPSHFHAVYLYSLESGKATQVTDGMSDARQPVFDRDGKHLYFLASTDVGPAALWLDLSSVNRPVTRSAYVVVLRKELPSPLAPESDEEKPEEEEKKGERGKQEGKAGSEGKAKADSKGKDAEAKKETPPVRVDLEGISQRILALPTEPAGYVGLEAGKEGTLYLVEGPLVPPDDPGPDGVKLTVHRFSLEKRKAEKLLEGVGAFDVSGSGEKALYRKEKEWFIGPAEPGKGDGEVKAIRLAEMEVWVEPRTEWRQMYREAWRLQRDFLYDPGFHGLDLAAAEQRYAPFLDGLASRDDLNYLFEEMLGELTLGHVYIGGGDRPEPRKVAGGLLGADYRIENGRYRIARVYHGENWNPKLRAPLTEPGVGVAPGDYLLAVNGRELTARDNVYAFLEGTADKRVVLKVGPAPDGKGAREVTVVPVADEADLRHRAWIDDNRRTVDRLSGGRVAYVYLPDTAGGGYASFNRYYFAQVGKQAVVLDERFNGGGYLADYVIDYLRRPLMSKVTFREGEDMASPAGSIYGPKVMLINEHAGSGGDALPWYFRKAGLGKLVGKRTWGGLVGIWDYPPLLDGGTVTAPRGAIYGLGGEWEVENVGVAPDVEVELDPRAWREGRDPQLEKAVALVLEELERNPLPTYRRPVYPDYHRTRR
jgi:tricorn protease